MIKKELIWLLLPRRKEMFELFRVDFKVIKPENFEERQYKIPIKRLPGIVLQNKKRL